MSARLTLWALAEGVSAQAAVEASTEADRGFGRKYLAHINPRWDVVALGDFPLNRSAAAGPGEFYIGGFAGVTVVQCEPESVTHRTNLSFDLRHLSTLPVTAWTRGVEHDHLYAIVMDEVSSLGGFAHWHKGQLKRCFSATVRDIIEDIGLPEPFEAPYWAGDFPPEETGKLTLPFSPVAFAAGAQNAWLGFPIDKDGPDVPVAGFAIDGRPVPKTSTLGVAAGGQSSPGRRGASDRGMNGRNSALSDAGRNTDGTAGPSRNSRNTSAAARSNSPASSSVSANAIFDDDPALAMTRPVDELSDHYGDGDEMTRTKNRLGWRTLVNMANRATGALSKEGDARADVTRENSSGRGSSSSRRGGSRTGRGVGILSNEPGPGFAASARGETAGSRSNSGGFRPSTRTPFHADRPAGAVDADADHAFDLAGGYDEYADFDDYATSPTDANRQFTELDAERIGRGLRRATGTLAGFLGRTIVMMATAVIATPGKIGDALRALARRGGRR